MLCDVASTTSPSTALTSCASPPGNTQPNGEVEEDPHGVMAVVEDVPPEAEEAVVPPADILGVETNAVVEATHIVNRRQQNAVCLPTLLPQTPSS